MSPELMDIQPRELKFTFELKKQSSCSVQLVNNSDQYVAFKVKTTSPKKYCVRPNIGIVQPKSTCDLMVTMQALRQAPPDMQCKDKFLIQNTVVPFGTTEDDITPSMFTKDSGNYIEENKLRVVLVSPPHSPVLLPNNGTLKLDPAYEALILRKQVLGGVENLPPPHVAAKAVEELKPGKGVDLKPAKDVEELKLSKELEKLKVAKEREELKLAKATEELTSNINELKSKLSEAENTITKLTKESSTIIQEKEALRKELQVLLRRNRVARKVYMGFPFQFVCMVALVGVAVGYLLRS